MGLRKFFRYLLPLIIPADRRFVIGQKYRMWINSPVNAMYNNCFAGAGPDVQIFACPLGQQNRQAT